MRSPHQRRALSLALALTLASGVAGLTHEMVWTRRLVDLLGASSDTFSKVIGAFFLGLALGAWLASRPSGGRANFWLRLAAAELAVAILALPSLFSMSFADAIWMRVSGRPLLKLLLSAALVVPPAAAMGMALPFLMRALAQRGALDGRSAIGLYAMNTLGGVLGVGATLLWALPRLGLTGAGLAAVGINLLIAVAASVAARVTLAVRSDPDLRRTENDFEIVRQRHEARPPIAAPALAFCSGFLVLALEVVLQHQFAQVTINSLFSSGLVLVIVLVSLTIAALFISRLVHWLGGPDRAMTFALAAAGVLCAVQPFLLTAMRDGAPAAGMNILPYELPAAEYVWEVLRLGAVTLCPALVAAGLVFPLVLLRAVGDASSGGPTAGESRRVGVLLAWNGLGGWMGAEVCQSWLAPALGLWTTVVVLAGGYAASLLWTVTGGGGSQWRPGYDNSPNGIKSRVFWRGLAASSLLVPALALSAWFSRSLPQTTIHSGERLAAIKVGREGVVAVVECGPDDWRMVFNNSYTLGGSRAQFNQERQAHLPLLLHGNARTVACLGVATDGTVAGAALHGGVECIDAAELSPLVLRFAQQWFAPYNRGVFRDARVRFIEEDARSVIAGKRETYDVVVGDLFLPWRTGEGRLFALEHFQNVKRSLKPGGLFCQWLPMFQLTGPQFEAIARTFREVFPDVFLLRGDFYTELPILGLVGGRTISNLEWAQVEEACGRLRKAGQVTDPLALHAEGVAMMVLAPLPKPALGPINTMGNGWLEWDAGSNILGLKAPWFVGVPEAEFLRELQRAGQPLLPPELRTAHDAGQFFLTLEVAAKLKLPVVDDLKSQIPERMPHSLREDARADWRQWPSRVKPDFARGPQPPQTGAPRRSSDPAVPIISIQPR